jgi:hypothetical protein
MEKLFINRFARINLTISFLLLSLPGFSQNISFVLNSYNPCSKEVKKINFFGLKKSDKIFSVDDTSGILRLKDTGIYVLSYAVDMIDSSQLGKKYHIRAIENYSDTLRLMSIYSCLEATSHPRFIGYCCCNEKCEGFQTDYYANGNKRIEGSFIRGKPIGKLIYYNRNGSINYVEKYNRKGKLKKKISHPMFVQFEQRRQ